MLIAKATSARETHSRIPIFSSINMALLYTPTKGMASVLIDAIAVGSIPINVYHRRWQTIIGTSAEYRTAINPICDKGW